MTADEAKEAIRKQAVIHFIDQPELWGVLTCLSDDESTAYYKRRGMGLFRYSATLEEIEVDQTKGRSQ